MIANANVAIITRTKDRSHFLRRAIRSVADQSYQDYIHVIVNDGGDAKLVNDVVSSLDKSAKAKIMVFHREQSSNAPDTIFNESIDRVDSRYFAIHDDDDTWHPEFLKKTVEYLDMNGDDGAVVARTDKIVEVVKSSRIIVKKRLRWMPDIKVINLYRQCIDNQMTPISTLYRRAAYEAVGKFDDTLPVVGDWEFGIRLLLKFDVGMIDPGYALAEYHHRAGNDNSFASHDHRQYTNTVMNRYLREELAARSIGVGYIMSSLKYEQGRLNNLVKTILPTFVVDKIKKRR